MLIDYGKQLHEVCPVFTNEVLELLWKWFYEKQKEEQKKSYEGIMQNQKFVDLISDITHLKSYTEPLS